MLRAIQIAATIAGLAVTANVEHNTISDANRHQPKGASTASSGQVLKAGGSDTTSWVSVGGDCTGAPDALACGDLTISGEAQGELLYYDGSGWESLGVGTAGALLKTLGAGANPAWSNVYAPSGSALEVGLSGAITDVDASLTFRSGDGVNASYHTINALDSGVFEFAPDDTAGARGVAYLSRSSLTLGFGLDGTSALNSAVTMIASDGVGSKRSLGMNWAADANQFEITQYDQVNTRYVGIPIVVGKAHSGNTATNSSISLVSGTGSASVSGVMTYSGTGNRFDFTGGLGVTHANTTADNLEKTGRYGTQHYDTDEEPFHGMTLATGAANNTLSLGGGTSSGNAATSVDIYIAATNTITTGTKIVGITSGVVDVAGEIVTNDLEIDNVTSCSAALETDADGQVVCGTDDVVDSNAHHHNGDTRGATSVIGTNDAYALALETNNATRMTITSAGLVGIGTTAPQSALDVEGGAAIGSSYSGTTAAPANGLIVEGSVGIGDSSPGSEAALVVEGGSRSPLSIGRSGGGAERLGWNLDNIGAHPRVFFSIRSAGTAPIGYAWASDTGSTINMLLTSGGALGVGTVSPASRLDVEGGAAIGSSYSGTTAAPANGLIIEGSVGIGDSSPDAKLDIETSSGVALQVSQAGTGNVMDLQDNTSSVLKIEDGGRMLHRTDQSADSHQFHTAYLATSADAPAVIWSQAIASDRVTAVEANCKWHTADATIGGVAHVVGGAYNDSGTTTGLTATPHASTWGAATGAVTIDGENTADLVRVVVNPNTATAVAWHCYIEAI